MLVEHPFRQLAGRLQQSSAARQQHHALLCVCNRPQQNLDKQGNPAANRAVCRSCRALICELIQVQGVLHSSFPFGIPRLSGFCTHLQHDPLFHRTATTRHIFWRPTANGHSSCCPAHLSGIFIEGPNLPSRAQAWPCTPTPGEPPCMCEARRQREERSPTGRSSTSLLTLRG